MVMADSLYTLICTDIGAAFDSEASNHEILHSQSNGSNAIYAGISTSQIRFPKETILEYLSRRKALGDCEKEWMVLHRKVEATIAENVQQAKDNNDRYVLKDGGYADLVLKALDGLEENGNGLLVSDMVDRGTASRDEEGNKDGNTSDKFYDYLFGELATRLPSAGKYLDGAPKKPDKANQTDKVAKAASDESESLLEYFIDCVNYIKRSSTGIAEAVLTFDENRGMALNKSLSIIEVILKKDNKFIHPVAAMVQLCRLKLKLAEFIEKHKSNVWGELKKRVIEELPAWAMELDSAPKPKSAARSAYANSPSGKNRFADLCNKPNDYKAKRTDARLDMEILRKDYESLINKINRQAVEQLQYAVFKKISDNLDILIEKYRNFFSRFDKEREELEEETKTVLRKDCGTVDSIINVYSSIADKEEILRDVFKNAGPESEAQLVETDDIAGKGVFATAYGAAVAASKQDETWNEKDSRAYRSLFTNMVAAYREYIAKSDAYAKIASFNVVQAIECSCKDKDKLESEFRTCFSTAQELATPSLRINTGDACGDLVKPSNVVVFMMSLETGKYIKLLKKGAKEFTKGITRRTKPYDACLKIYRRLILKLDYDGIGLNIRAGEDIGSDDSLRSLYSALVEHKVVCAGYAFAMQYLLQFVGISAAYVSSETAPGNTTHAFNTLRIGKYCYYIDATWGDNSNTMTGETNRGRITYDYFCVPYREFVMTGGNAREYHEPRKEYYTNLEEFKATRHEYFRHNDAYFDRYDEDKLMKLIVRTANEYDEKEMGDFCIAFRAANEQVRDYIVDMLWNKGKLSDIIGRAKEVIKKKKKKALLEGNLIMSAQKGLPTAYFWIMPEKNGRK